MIRLLILATAFGLAASQAGACEYMKSVSNVDTTKVASISTDDAQKMSKPAPASVERDKAAPVITE